MHYMFISWYIHNNNMLSDIHIAAMHSYLVQLVHVCIIIIHILELVTYDLITIPTYCDNIIIHAAVLVIFGDFTGHVVTAAYVGRLDP